MDSDQDKSIDHTAMTDEAIVDLYIKIVSSVASTHLDHSDGWFARYEGPLADPAMGQRYVRSIRNKLGRFASGLEDKSFLDLGCGFGMTCTTVAALGAKAVHGIDNFQPMVDTFSAYAQSLPFGDRLHPAQGEADKLPYETGQFDIVMTVEALSHITNTDGCLAEAYRVLKPGGVLLIADDNNAANPSVVKRNKEIWDTFENGPPTADIHGHAIRIPYINGRESILREAFPSLTDEEVRLLSGNTAYMTRPEIVDAARAYLEEKAVPQSRYTSDRCPIQPETGHTMESLQCPYSMRSTLNDLGFETEVSPYFFGESRGGLALQTNNLLGRLLSEKLLFRYCEGLRVVAIKH